MTRLIAIASGKGGAGKTTTTVNLGAALTSFGKSVILIDANLTTPNLGLHFGIHKTETTLNDVLEGKASIVDAIYLHESGLRIIPAGLHLKHVKTTNPEKLWDVVLDLFGSADFVLLDTPAGLEKGALSVLDVGEEVLMVTNPEIPAMTDALKTVRIARQMGTDITGAVMNKVKMQPHEVGMQRAESILDTPIIAIVPHDIEISRSINAGNPVVFRAPNSPAARAFMKLGADLIGVKYELSAQGRPVVNTLKRLFGI